MKYFAGIVDPETLSDVERNPRGELFRAAGLCSALEIRYDLFLSGGIPESGLPVIAERLSALFPKALLIGTFRLERDGGAIPDELANERLRWMLPVLSAGAPPRIVDVEIECLDALLPKIPASAQVLASHHDFQRVPSAEELGRLVSTAESFGVAGFKAACMATSAGDFDCAYPLIERVSSRFRYFSLFAMGDFGSDSRIKSLRFGANLTYCSLRKAVAPGQLSIAGALEKYRQMAQIRQNSPNLG